MASKDNRPSCPPARDPMRLPEPPRHRFARTAILLAPMMLALLGAHANALTLKIATLSPEGSSWMTTLHAAADAVAERTEGRVRLRFYAGGVMGGDQAMLRKMRIGQIHGAAITAASLAPIASEAQLYSLPMLFRNFDEVDHVRARFDPVVIEALEAAGYPVLGLAEAGFAYAMARTPVLHVEEIRDQRVWTPQGDRAAQVAIEGFGVQPVPLALGDVLVGLQTGLVSAVTVPPIGALALQWHTALTHVLDLPLLYVYGTLILTDRAFEQLAAPDRTVLRSVMQAAFESISAANRADHQAAFDALLAQDIERLAPDGATRAAWQAAANTSIEGMITQDIVRRDQVDAIRSMLDSIRDGSSQAAED